MKKLILMRHGHADDQYVGDDYTRPLTSKGKEIQTQMGQLLKGQEIHVDGILFSPLTRAQESAKILAKSFPGAILKKEMALGEVFDSYTVLKNLNKKKFNTSVLVGHEPTLALLAAHLMKDFKPFKLDKSGALVLEFEDNIDYGQGNFKLYLSPEDLKS